jgi:hypothetical protein
MAPPQGQPHVGVNFVQPSPIQQFQNFEQLNTENPWPISRIMPKRKEKTETIIIQDQGEITPNKTNLLGATRIKGTRTPKGEITTNAKGKNNNNLQTNFPCALCGEYGHYTHHFPQIVDFKWMKESMNGPRPPAPPAPQQAPQQYVQQPPPAVLQNPIPHQGVMNTQQEMHPAPPQMGQYQNPGTPADHTILLTSEEEILLQTCSRQYNTPPESTPTTSEAVPVTTGPPLMIPCPNTETPLRIPRIPLRRNVNNPQARATHNYSLVDDLAQSPATMSVLEVLQTCPTQRKSLLSTLGAVDPADTRLITFDLDCGEPHLPTLVAFQIPVKIQNITVHRCIIDEGASTCIMSKTVWQKLGSPELIPSTITLRAYDG